MQVRPISLMSVMALLGSALVFCVPAMGQLARATVEKPEYNVLSENEDYEIRQYPACIVAQIKIPASEVEAMSQGFRPLADYIFGNNVSKTKVAMTSPVTQEVADSEKIAMTSPVVQEAASAEATDTGHHLVQFIMPAGYTMESLPTPRNPDVTLAAKAARTYAVLRFSGRGNDEQMRTKEKTLREYLTRDGIAILGGVQYARYDPPWTLPPMRRNEVMIPVASPEKSNGNEPPAQASEPREKKSP